MTHKHKYDWEHLLVTVMSYRVTGVTWCLFNMSRPNSMSICWSSSMEKEHWRWSLLMDIWPENSKNHWHIYTQFNKPLAHLYTVQQTIGTFIHHNLNIINRCKDNDSHIWILPRILCTPTPLAMPAHRVSMR